MHVQRGVHQSGVRTLKCFLTCPSHLEACPSRRSRTSSHSYCTGTGSRRAERTGSLCQTATRLWAAECRWRRELEAKTEEWRSSQRMRTHWRLSLFLTGEQQQQRSGELHDCSLKDLNVTAASSYRTGGDKTRGWDSNSDCQLDRIPTSGEISLFVSTRICNASGYEFSLWRSCWTEFKESVRYI